MTRMFDRRSSKVWSSERLRKLLRGTARAGEIHSYEVTRAGDVDQPDAAEVENSKRPVTVGVPYAVSYDSRALPQDVELEGTFDMVYDHKAEEWGVRFDKRLLWPGVDGAAGFATRYRWLRRGTIMDRNGRRLAFGPASRRRYPLGPVAGLTVGHLQPSSPPGRRTVAPAAGALVGGSGLEAGLNQRLSGKPAAKLVVLDRRGRVAEVVGEAKGRPGRPVKTTLDVGVQRAAEAAFGATVGGAVVLDPRSGNLLAIVSSAFDPNDYLGSNVEPFNRALAGLYPPGSAMKVVTASAALDSKVVTPGTNVTGPKEYRGVSNFESGVFGTIDFATAVQFSVNTAFAQVAEKLGPARLTKYATAFGFNRPPSLPVDASESSFPFPAEDYDLLWGSIGQARVLASPLEMATVAATVANKGLRMEPRLTTLSSREGRRVVSRRTARTMNGLMQRVVEAGTGVNAQIPGVAVAGKTGTAEVNVDGEIMNHAWFVAFAPAQKPKVAMAVVAELGGVGGEVAAPLARNILASVLPKV